MSKTPFHSWLAIQERRRSSIIFLVEWLALFASAWMFWWVMFWAAPGSLSPRIAATAVSALYATALIYGRVLRATGCKRCSSPMPFLRKEIGRRQLPDQEDCIEIEYGGEDFGLTTMQTYCQIVRSEMVTCQCSHCGQMWEERVQLPGSGYQLVRRTDIEHH